MERFFFLARIFCAKKNVCASRKPHNTSCHILHYYRVILDMCLMADRIDSLRRTCGSET